MSSLQTLQYLINQIQIKSSNLSINHPKCQNLQIPIDTFEQLKELSPRVRDEYFISFLQKSIFDIYFSGLLLPKETKLTHDNYQFELKDSTLEVDWEFYEELNSNNHGKGSWNPNFTVLKHEANGSLLVQKKNIATHIKKNIHLHLKEQSANVGDVVSVTRPPNHIRKQFYIAYGDLVYTWQHPSVFIYFNFCSQGALVFMKHLTKQLNVIKIPFDFDVLYNPSMYGQYNSGILRINKDSYKIVKQILQDMYANNKVYFQSSVPIFTKALAPGISVAEKPKKEFRFLEGFGMNRCKIVANALLEAHRNNDESPEARMRYIAQHFENLGIDLERPYLNPSSEDIYTPLNLTNSIEKTKTSNEYQVS